MGEHFRISPESLVEAPRTFSKHLESDVFRYVFIYFFYFADQISGLIITRNCESHSPVKVWQAPARPVSRSD